MQKEFMAEPKPKSKLDDMTGVPQILLGYVRDKKGNIVGVRHCDCKAGTRIERCGKTYMLTATGQQIRVP